ncbi:hypothetical protein [Desulfohalovibrio reitneri]|uniref:hypothetical protein n=1 Tax=Desulfohalovibrio reitneri TaxID=1307759 RepID=UPI0004A764F1|nr:hypothetical protein [Desulfohalovibrio reitneri]
MAVNKKEFALGAGLMVVFLVVLVAMFMPLFNGLNAMQYLDRFYNQVSKESAYYIPEQVELAESLRGQDIDAELPAANPAEAERMAKLFQATGASASAMEKAVRVSGDLGALLLGSLEDAELMYRNNDQALEAKYGFPGRLALYDWWLALGSLDKQLGKEKRFEAATKVQSIRGRAVEASYNFFGIEPMSIAVGLWVAAGSLAFYVVYTLWYGFSILFMFEGAGFRLEH